LKLKDLQNLFHQELDTIYGIDEVNGFFYLLTEAFYNVSRMQLALDPHLTITKEEQNPISEALDRLKKEEPIQYILGETEFFGLKFQVNSNTLIPRPETEELVAWILEEVKGKEEVKILDIGTGSGCIAIALAKNIENAQVYGLDVSAKALELAKKNAFLNAVTITFIETNILNASSAEQVSVASTFDIIVSNPPYVRNLEKAKMMPNVLEHEPHLALFVEDNNALQFYKVITKLAVHNLEKNGRLFFEINEYLGNEMIQLLNENSFEDVQLKQDVFGKNRMIKGTKSI